jgi:hypothetical protein
VWVVDDCFGVTLSYHLGSSGESKPVGQCELAFWELRAAENYYWVLYFLTKINSLKKSLNTDRWTYYLPYKPPHKSLWKWLRQVLRDCQILTIQQDWLPLLKRKCHVDWWEIWPSALGNLSSLCHAFSEAMTDNDEQSKTMITKISIFSTIRKYYPNQMTPNQNECCLHNGNNWFWALQQQCLEVKHWWTLGALWKGVKHNPSQLWEELCKSIYDCFVTVLGENRHSNASFSLSDLVPGH